MQHTLLRVLVHETTNNLLHDVRNIMLRQEIECKAIKDEVLFIPSMERAMPAGLLLTWDVVMPPLHDGKLPEAAETEVRI